MTQGERESGWRAELTDWVKTGVAAFSAFIAFTTVAFAQYEIPSESMVPHLEVGDRVTVSKFAYGYSRYSLPFEAGRLLPAHNDRFFASLPRRGDVVVFIHPVSGMTMIKRAIGLPGDVIEVRNGDLFINGVRAPTSSAEAIQRRSYTGARQSGQRYDETLPGGIVHATLTLTPQGQFDTYGPYTVPDDHIFFMGDNRDNSLDSRWSGMGVVPMENLIGRAELVYVTALGDCESGEITCPMQRWLRPPHH